MPKTIEKLKLIALSILDIYSIDKAIIIFTLMLGVKKVNAPSSVHFI